MKRININYLVLPAAALGFVGCGNGPIDKISESTTQTSQSDFTAADFVAKSALTVRPVRLEGEDNPEGEILIPEGASVSVIETKVDAVHGTIVRLGLDVNEDSGVPSDIWVKLDQALLLGLVREDGNEAEEEESFGLTEEVKKKKKGGKPMTYCYRYVKRYLMSTGQVKTYLPGESAYMAAKILPKHGFKRTGNTPKTAKNGEVCVYSGGPKGHGHIEVKRDGKWWYGYGFKVNPIQNRKFIACFNK